MPRSSLFASLLLLTASATLPALEPFWMVEGRVVVQVEDAAFEGWREVEGVVGPALEDEGGSMVIPLMITEAGLYHVWFRDTWTGDTSGERNDCFIRFDGKPIHIRNAVGEPFGIVTHHRPLQWSCKPKVAEQLKDYRGRRVYLWVDRPGKHELRIDSRSQGYVLDTVVLQRSDQAPNWADRSGSSRHAVDLAITVQDEAVAEALAALRQGNVRSAMRDLERSDHADAQAVLTAFDAWLDVRLAHIDGLLAAGDPQRAGQAAAFLDQLLRRHPRSEEVASRIAAAEAHPHRAAGEIFLRMLEPLHEASSQERSELLASFAQRFGPDSPYLAELQTFTEPR